MINSHINQTIDNLCSPKANITRQLKDLDTFEFGESSSSFLDSPFSYEELEFSHNNVNIKSSPGLDKINYEILPKLLEFFKRVLLDLYNEFFNKGCFPKQWKEYLVIFIPKGNQIK